MAPLDLVELDFLSITAIIDNELDPISPSPNEAVKQSGNLPHIALRGPERPKDDTKGSGTRHELRMDNICCSAHGLSLLITGTKNGESHTILFDTGPEESAWERNATRLRADIAPIEVVQLSHWHRDHSGGMLKVLEMINAARKERKKTDLSPVSVDLHPKRPLYSGMWPPNLDGPISFEADPTFEEIEKLGAEVRKSDQPHGICKGWFGVSGEIPRVTEYEKGLKFGVRLHDRAKGWEEDAKMPDERLLMCRLKGKGIVMFTGCSHAGVVNASKHAVELGGGAPLYAVMGGFHLADADAEHIQSTVDDLKALDTQLMLAGHCTGWRAKFKIQEEMPGRLVPSFVGTKFEL